MRMAKVKLSKEELRALFFFHKDIADDDSFACKQDQRVSIRADRRKRANKFRKLLKKEFGYEIAAEKTDD